MGLDAQQVQDIVKATVAACGVNSAVDPWVPEDPCPRADQVSFLSSRGRGGNNYRGQGRPNRGGPTVRPGNHPYPDDDPNNPGAPRGRDQEVFTQLIDLLKSRNPQIAAPVSYYFDEWSEDYSSEEERSIDHMGHVVSQVVGRSYSNQRTSCWYCGRPGHIFFRCGRLFSDIREGRVGSPQGIVPPSTSTPSTTKAAPAPQTTAVNAVNGYPIPYPPGMCPAPFVGPMGYYLPPYGMPPCPPGAVASLESAHRADPAPQSQLN